MIGWLLVMRASLTVAPGQQPAPYKADDADRTTATMPQEQRVGDIHLRFDSSSTETSVASPIELHLVVDAPDGVTVALPTIGPVLGPFDVISSRRMDGLPVDGTTGRRRWTLALTIESIESGLLEVPSLEVIYRFSQDASGSTDQVLRSEPFEINVRSLLSDEADPRSFRDIKDPIEATSTTPVRSLQLGLATACLVALAAGAAGLAWRRRKRTPNAFAWACSEIDQLESTITSDTEGTAAAYDRLSSVLRRFLEGELGIPASAQSSRELRDELVARSFPATATETISQFLLQADEVKFAGRLPSQPPATKSPAQRARDIIRQIHEVSTSNGQGK